MHGEHSLCRCACEFGEAWAIGERLGELAGVAYWLGLPEADLSAEQEARLGADAAAAELPLVLVTDRAVNVPFYERAGLQLVAQGAALAGALPWWTFRTPRA